MNGDEYDLYRYMERLAVLKIAPTQIVLGPAEKEWTEEMNSARVAALLPLLRAGCDILWSDIPKARREYVWSLSA